MPCECKNRISDLLRRIQDIEDWIEEFEEFVDSEVVFTADEGLLRDGNKDN